MACFSAKPGLAKELSAKADSVTGTLGSARDVAATHIGAIARGNLSRKELQEKHDYCVKVQARVRGKAARRKVGQLLAERECSVTTTEATLTRKKNTSTIQKINEYHVGKKLGEGAFGQVFKVSRGSKNSDDVAAAKVRTFFCWYTNVGTLILIVYQRWYSKVLKRFKNVPSIIWVGGGQIRPLAIRTAPLLYKCG